MKHYLLIPAVLICQRALSVLCPNSDVACRNVTLTMAALAVVLIVRGELSGRQQGE